MENEIVRRFFDDMDDMFSIYTDGPTLSDGKKVYPEDIIAEKYPELTETELETILQYLEEAESFCEDIGQELADRSKCPFLPDENAPEVVAAIKECQAKYPWLSEDVVKELFSTVSWLTNR